MREEQNRALLVSLIKALRERGSWCGETHIQKAAFLLKHLTDVPIGYDFILYKHGPYSFDLHDELSVMRAYGMLDLEANYPYGPRIMGTELGDTFINCFPKKPAQYKKQIEFIADKLGDKGVVALERLATAYFVRYEYPQLGEKDRAKLVVDLKPHISLEAAMQAFLDVDEFIKDAQKGELIAA